MKTNWENTIAISLMLNTLIGPFMFGIFNSSALIGFQYFLFGGLGFLMVFFRYQLSKRNIYINQNKDLPEIRKKRLEQEKKHLSVDQIKNKNAEISLIESKVNRYYREIHFYNNSLNIFLAVASLGLFLNFLLNYNK